MKSRNLSRLVLTLIVGTLCACSGRLDPQEASTASVKAATIFKAEFARRAPKLTAKDLQLQIEAALETIDRQEGQPRLERDYFTPLRPVFVSTSGPTQELETVLRACTELVIHGFDPSAYPCREVSTLAQQTRKEVEALTEDLRDSALSGAHLEKLKSHLMTLEGEQIRDDEGGVRDEALLAIMFGAEGFETPLPHIDKTLSSLEGRHEALAEKLAALEVKAHSVLLNHIWDLRARHADIHWGRIETQRKWLNELADNEVRRTRLNQDRLRVAVPEGWPKSDEAARGQSLQKFMAMVGQQPTAEIVAAATPPGDQYRRLLKARTQYEQIRSTGGFAAVEMGKVTPGRASSLVPSLRRRLAQEGYEVEAADPQKPEVYDGPLQRALRAFEAAHQISARGKLSKETRAALAIPVERKLSMVRLALEKWREANPMDEDHIFVNIPDFHGELWVKGQRQHRFRVVVGDRKGRWRKGSARKYVNATPETVAFIDRVVYNPYWNVPKRIFKKEILRKKGEEMEEEERHDYLRGKGFQVMAKGKKNEWVRQPPGPGNALGKLKIIFPNPHEIYMHDTQSKNLFQRPLRAYSHGCVRVHEPLVLARQILERDQQYDGKRIKRLLRRYTNEKIFLKEKLPVYINYITVRVDDAGIAHFLTDIYQRDVKRLAAAESK